MILTLQSIQHLSKTDQKSYLTAAISATQAKVAAVSPPGSNGAINELAIEMAAHQYLLQQVR